MPRLRVWLAVSPLIALGVLVSHALAYRLTGTDEARFHAYLEHAPESLLVLAVVGLALAGVGARLRTPRTWPFPVAAVVTFVAQEHLERLGHGGPVSEVATTRAFLLGLVLQAVVALLVWGLARRLLGALELARARVPPCIPEASTEVPARLVAVMVPARPRPYSGRAPPSSRPR